MVEEVEVGTVPAPSVELIQEEIEATESAEAAKESWLESPEAVRQREESQHAFADIPVAETESLLPLFFSKELAVLNADPARSMDELEIEKTLETNAALISEGDGEYSILESSAPIVADIEQNDDDLVDLDLEPSGTAFVPRNPVSDLSLPQSTDESIRLENGVEIDIPAEVDRSAQPLEDIGLIYPDTATATDTILAPISGGVEVFEMLRSPESPETMRLQLNLPSGSQLRSNEGGGAEVVTGAGRLLVWVPPAIAVDAQGTPVPVEMEVNGDSLILEILHRSRDLAYPILLDPKYVEESTSFGAWGPASNDQYSLWNSPVLGAQAKGSSYSYAANSYGHWVWTTHGGTTYISQATFSPTTFTLPANCATEQPTNHPHGYAGLYNPSSGGYSGLGTWYGGSSSGGYSTQEDAGGPGVRQAVVGIGAGPATVKHKCAFTFEVGGVTVRQKDPEAPTFTSVESSGAWSSGQSNLVIGASASDPGLGVQAIDIKPEGRNTTTDWVGCNGTTGNQCPSSRYHQFSLKPEEFNSGETTTMLTARDPIEHETKYGVTTRIDFTPPVIDLQGQLATITKEEGKAEKPKDESKDNDELRFPVYNLKISATDQGPNGKQATEAGERRSGVKNIKLYLEQGAQKEELKVGWTPQGCSGPIYSCPMEKTYPLELAGRESGWYTLTVIVEDQVGRKTERKIDFRYIPATGMKDEYAMQYFPLPDGTGDEESEEHPRRPELAVNVMSGNLVFRQSDVDVEGPAADLEVERFYNSQLPESENTEWGDGWTLAQTPSLELEGGGTPTEATMVAESGLVQSEVELPSKVGEEVFDPEVQATVAKEPSGYSVTDETGESPGTVVFDSAGEASEMETGEFAGVDYSYSGGDLSEIAVHDPATVDHLPDEIAGAAEAARTPAYSSSFGSTGSGPGQLRFPGDVEVDPAGNLWVVDMNNNRIVKFSESGQYISSFGTRGSGNGQLIEPVALAIDAAGNIWVCDYGNKRVQEFNAKGEYVRKFGSEGTGNGQFKGPGPEGIEIAANGNVWVSDSHAGRIEVFSPTGGFIKVVGSAGTGPGQFGEPQDIARGPGGDMFVADWVLGRVAVFNEAGEFLRQFGSMGSGPGQMYGPYGIAVDAGGTVYVADRLNNRIDVFNDEGEFIARLGSEGTGPGQLYWRVPIGVAVASKGNLWVTDSLSDRIQHWTIAADAQEVEAEFALGDDPSVEVDTSGGLVESVHGTDAGEHAYEHEGDLLSSYEGPEGETDYDYNKEFNKDKRLTKVTLPNGTYGEVAYETKGRVSSVTVSDEGAIPQTTVFEYQDEPTRRTTVKRPKELPVIYDIGEDGSVFQSQSQKSPPSVALTGSLYANKESAAPIGAGDYELVAESSSPAAAISSTQIIANGTTLVDEKLCVGTCKQDEDRWVTNTGNWAPGILYLEVLVTDTTGEITSKRFWMNIPYTPPPDPEAEVPPTFAEVLAFRERKGLDLDVKGNERIINGRIFDLIWAWNHPGTPEGEVARAASERWGMPLRAVDVAELEYREQYVNYNAPLIEDWGEAHSSTFAGYVLDEAAGGIIRVGFTSNPVGQLSELKQQAPLMAQDRFGSQIAPNGYSLASLQQLVGSLSSEQENNPNLSASIVSVAIDLRRNLVRVGGPNTSQLAASLQSLYGASSPFAIEYAPGGISLSGERLMAGENLRTRYVNQENSNTVFTDCTAGYGAFRKIKKNGSWIRVNFLLSAGHCSDVGQPAQKYKYPHGQDNYFGIGDVTKSSWQGWHKWETDALAIKLEGLPAPTRIFWQGSPPASRRVTPMGRSHPGDELCFSGVVSNFPKCGEAHEIEERRAIYEHGVQHGRQWKIPISVGCEPGDSGAPVWDKTTGRVVGLLVEKESSRNLPDFWNTTTVCYATPLVNPKGVSTGQAPGVFGAAAFEGLQLSEAP